MKIVKKIANIILENLIKRCAKRDSYGDKYLSKILQHYENNSPNYVCYKLYPKETTAFTPSVIQTCTEQGEFAIVMQGPIVTKDNFTLETVRLYRAIFPLASIIVSTWEDAPKDILKELNKLGAHVVINKIFQPNGFGNVNYQITTSLAGANKAKEIGAVLYIR